MGNSRKRENIATELIAMLLDDTISPGTKEMIRAWFWSHVSRDAKDAALAEYFQNLVPNPTPTAEDIRRFAELAARLNINDMGTLVIPRRKTSRLLSRPVRVAASVLLILGISGGAYWWVYEAINSAERLKASEITVTGQYPEHAVSLPDGSTVTLGQDATISYDKHFDGDRAVILTGQAKFHVAEAEDEAGRQRSFTVQTDDLEVHVLGTVFNVEAVKHSGISRVALYEGAVQIHSGDAATDLQPGEALSHNNGTKEHTVSLMPAEEMIRHGFKPLLRFDRSSLANLMLSLEANFGVQFILPQGIDMESEAISADFEGLLLQDIVNLLSVTDKQYSYSLNGNTITITNKKIILDE